MRTLGRVLPLLLLSLGSVIVVPGGIELASRASPRLRPPEPRLTRWEGVTSLDVSGALDGRPEGEEVYLDFCHVNHVANRRIAERMFEGIVGS